MYKLTIIISLLLLSCMPSENEYIYWVNSYQVNCAGVGAMKCLLIQKGDTIKAGAWQNFHAKIQGFNYEPGFIYKLKVKEEKLENVPADAPSIKYTLVKMIEKKKDTNQGMSNETGTEAKLLLNDIWVAEVIDGETIAGKPSIPRLEINSAQMQATGTDGCNNFSGKITTLTNQQLQFGPLASTRKMCIDMKLANTFNNLITKSRSYTIKNLKLSLYDEQGKLLMIFKKAD